VAGWEPRAVGSLLLAVCGLLKRKVDARLPGCSTLANSRRHRCNGVIMASLVPLRRQGIEREGNSPKATYLSLTEAKSPRREFYDSTVHAPLLHPSVHTNT
jgi:hypothetical protein